MLQSLCLLVEWLPLIDTSSKIRNSHRMKKSFRKLNSVEILSVMLMRLNISVIWGMGKHWVRKMSKRKKLKQTNLSKPSANLLLGPYLCKKRRKKENLMPMTVNSSTNSAIVLIPMVVTTQMQNLIHYVLEPIMSTGYEKGIRSMQNMVLTWRWQN